ncbi:MAG TPA: ornithine carbamoyltransferase [Ideonella sp.]|jgi:ornithine carbamoyltransferase|nr:ornithine carbamoyltransferase [Ideonella sp.]
MPRPLNPLALGRFDGLTDSDLHALSDRARALRRGALANSAHRPLRGRNIGLLCETTADPDATLFERAATGLGAHVSHIRPSVADLAGDDAVQATARMLGRLYDAVECEGLPGALVERLRTHAGVPVFDGLGSAAEPGATLAAALDGGQVSADNRIYLIQAALLATIGQT